MSRIFLLAALPDEYRYLRRLTGQWRYMRFGPFRGFINYKPYRELILVETGMGRERICAALDLIKGEQAELVISFGFAGSLHDRLKVGDVCLGVELVLLNSLPGNTVDKVFKLQQSLELSCFCEKHGIRKARIVTVDRVIPKHSMRRCFDKTPTLIDMESYFAALHASERGIPFIPLRAVSDGCNDEIDYDLDAITDIGGHVKVLKVIEEVLKKPPLVKSFYASWRRSLKASRNLGLVLSALLDMVDSNLLEIEAAGMLARSPGSEENRS